MPALTSIRPVKTKGVGKRALAALPVPSTSFTTDVAFTFPGGEAELHYEFVRDGAAVRGGIHFEWVRAFRFRAESHCTPWHTDGAYDTLVEVIPSDWVSELVRAQPRKTPWHWDIRHFLIYLDSAGAFEIAAASWSWLAEAPVG